MQVTVFATQVFTLIYGIHYNGLEREDLHKKSCNQTEDSWHYDIKKKTVQDGTSQLLCCAMAPGGFSINVWMVQIYDHNRAHFNESKPF